MMTKPMRTRVRFNNEVDDDEDGLLDWPADRVVRRRETRAKTRVADPNLRLLDSTNGSVNGPLTRKTLIISKINVVVVRHRIGSFVMC